MFEIALTIASLASPAAPTVAPVASLSSKLPRVSFSKLAGAAVLDPKGEKAATIEDVFVDAKTGRILQVLIGTEPLGPKEPRKLVVWDTLTWTKNGIVSSLSRSKLLRLPPFDPKKLARTPNARSIRGLLKQKILGRNGEFGSVTDVVIHTRENRAAYIAVRERTTRNLCHAPWLAVTLGPARKGPARKGKARIDLPLGELRGAPGLHGPMRADLEKPRYRRLVHGFFAGVGRYEAPTSG